jgi:hypothetical protein
MLFGVPTFWRYWFSRRVRQQLCLLVFSETVKLLIGRIPQPTKLVGIIRIYATDWDEVLFVRPRSPFILYGGVHWLSLRIHVSQQENGQRVEAIQIPACYGCSAHPRALINIQRLRCDVVHKNGREFFPAIEVLSSR